jgi:hypothetical protein
MLQGHSAFHWRGKGHDETKTDCMRICLVKFDMNNRVFGPYLAAIASTLTSAVIHRQDLEEIHQENQDRAVVPQKPSISGPKIPREALDFQCPPVTSKKTLSDEPDTSKMMMPRLHMSTRSLVNAQRCMISGEM